MTWVWATLLVAGIALLAYTSARVVVGGLVPGPGRPADRDRHGPDQTEDTSPVARSSARRILEERYASGELSTQEYEHRRAVLTGREEES